MSERVITPDLEFVKDVINSGGDTLKKCYQCSTCTVVCSVTPEDRPFPRKEMLYAQWGMKDELMSNPDIWLCHQCSDCTAYCPRGAKPGEVLGAVRKMSIKEFSAPSFLANMTASPKMLLLLLAIPVLIFLMVLSSVGSLSSVPRGDNGAIVFSKFVPIIYIDTIFTAAFAFAAVVFAFGIRKYWKMLSAGMTKWDMKACGSIVSTIISIVKEIMGHKRFNKCSVTKARSVSHFLVFYSFIGLAITTTWAVVYLYGFKLPSPYHLLDPLKILGNTSAVALIIGIIMVMVNRFKNSHKAGLGSYFDWLFISIILVIAVTGMMSQLLRLADMPIAYPMYFAHLVSVFFLFAYAPYSKMAHMVYRAVAMVFSKHTGREA